MKNVNEEGSLHLFKT